jgi:PIN domain nuclease of toxin-antitoxin system
MIVLLDSASFIWLTQEPEQLSKRAQECCENPQNTLYLSPVSVAEISQKYHHRKLDLPSPPSTFIPQERSVHGIQSLPLDEAASVLLESLPLLHKDPFDRLLICQALAHDCTILTPDRNIRQYAVATAW